MIPLTGDQIAVLVKARDILGEKAIEHDQPYAGLCEAVQNSVLMVLKHAYVELEGPAHGVVLQGDSSESCVPTGFVNLGRINGTVRNT